MAHKQETLIYIEKENVTEAEFMSRSFVNPEIKNRAYINAIGAELLIKYLASEGIKVANLHNIHSISKILEKLDIADVLLPNIHIDARVIFDEKYIFIPKSHFKLEITPDIYVVLKLDKSFNHVEFLGYFEPKKINKKNANSNYYFITKNKLSSPDTLKQYIKNFTGSTSRKISEEDMLRGRELSISLADHNTTEDEEKELLELLLLSDDLRESILEFDNFETLAYSVAPEIEKALPPGQEFTLLTDEDEDHQEQTFAGSEDNGNEDDEEINNSEINLDMVEEDVLLDDSFFENFTSTDENNTPQEEETSETNIDNVEENNTEKVEENYTTGNEKVANQDNDELPEPEDLSLSISSMDEDLIDLGDDMLDRDISMDEDADIDETTLQASLEPLEDFGDEVPENNITLPEQNELINEESFEKTEEEPAQSEMPVNNVVQEELIETEPEMKFNAEAEIENMAQVTEKEAVKNNETTGNDISKGLAETISNALQNAGKVSAETTSSAAEEISEAASSGAVSKDAIKLAGIAGDMISDVVNKNIEKQQHNLDKIDYAKTDIAPDTQEIPEHIAALDLSTAKLEANIEAEISGQFDTPKDLSELKTVEPLNRDKEEVFEHETIDLGQMETIKTEEFTEHTEDVVNLEHLSNIDSPTRPVDNLHEIMKEPEFVGMDLPDLSTYTINEDGTSTMDNFATDMSLQNNNEEHLIDMNLNNEISFDNDFITDDFSSDYSDAEELLNNETTEPITTETESQVAAEISTSNERTLTDEEIAVLNSIKFDEPSSNENVEDPAELSEAASLNDDNIIASQDFSDDLNFDNSIENFENVESVELPDELTSETLQESLEPADKETATAAQDDFTQTQKNDYSEEPQLIQDDDLQTELTYNEYEAMTNDKITIQDNDQTPEEMQSEFTTDQEDWMTDTDYNNLQDIENPQPELTADEQQPSHEISDETNMDEFITEPEIENQKIYTVRENSRVISDKTFKAGEIPIDINDPNMPELPPDESLESLYNQNSKLPGGSLLQTPGRLTNLGGNPRAGLGIGLGIVGALITLAIVCVIGINVAKMFKTPTEETPQPITDDALPTSPDNGVTDSNTLNVNPDNVVNMDNNTNALATTKKTSTSKTNAQPAAAQQINQPAATQKKQSGSSFIEVKKLTWEIPDYVSYNPQFKQYFQSVGKSLKLSLTSDLLLANDYAYSNEIRVSVTFDKEGVFKNAQMIISSGSTQIDNIVLQTVNQTLKVLKAPHSVGNDESTTAILKIYL